MSRGCGRGCKKFANSQSARLVVHRCRIKFPLRPNFGCSVDVANVFLTWTWDLLDSFLSPTIESCIPSQVFTLNCHLVALFPPSILPPILFFKFQRLARQQLQKWPTLRHHLEQPCSTQRQRRSPLLRRMLSHLVQTKLNSKWLFQTPRRPMRQQ